jgi:hypothetical protein
VSYIWLKEVREKSLDRDERSTTTQISELATVNLKYTCKVYLLELCTLVLWIYWKLIIPIVNEIVRSQGANAGIHLQSFEKH